MTPIDTSGKQPYQSGLLSRIVRIHFPERRYGGILYLILSIDAGNSRGESGPGAGAESVDMPNIAVNPISAVMELDEYQDPDGNVSNEGMGGCMTYIPQQSGVVDFGPWPGDCSLSPPIYGSVGQSAAAAYRSIYHGGFSYMTYITPTDPPHTSCKPQPTSTVNASQSVFGDGCSQDAEYSVSVSTIPVNAFSGANYSIIYLYRIPVGEEIITIDVGGLIDTESSSSDGIGSYQSGGGSIAAYVYSTARQSYTRVDQLMDIYGDDLPRLDYDDAFTISLGPAEEQGPAVSGTFYVNVWQDTTTSQIDNYGMLFHPFKVTIEPRDQSPFWRELIPDQPPQPL